MRLLVTPSFVRATKRLHAPQKPDTTPVTVMTMVSEQYDYTLTLLRMPDAEWRSPQHDDEEPLEDTFDRFIHNGQPLVR